jgi:hypothetical protein
VRSLITKNILKLSLSALPFSFLWKVFIWFISLYSNSYHLQQSPFCFPLIQIAASIWNGSCSWGAFMPQVVVRDMGIWGFSIWIKIGIWNWGERINYLHKLGADGNRGLKEWMKLKEMKEMKGNEGNM